MARGSTLSPPEIPCARGARGRRRALAWLALSLGASALGAGSLASLGCASDAGPVDPVWGKQPCGHCAMVVSERRHAAQATVQGGPPLYFDDLGCLALWLEQHPGAKAWARDAEGRWVDATRASYATGAKTPMGFGFETSAQGSASWADVVRESKARSQGKAKGKGEHEHGGH